jgi:hypothetical protein
MNILMNYCIAVIFFGIMKEVIKIFITIKGVFMKVSLRLIMVGILVGAQTISLFGAIPIRVAGSASGTSTTSTTPVVRGGDMVRPGMSTQPIEIEKRMNTSSSEQHALLVLQNYFNKSMMQRTKEDFTKAMGAVYSLTFIMQEDEKKIKDREKLQMSKEDKMLTQRNVDAARDIFVRAIDECIIVNKGKANINITDFNDVMDAGREFVKVNDFDSAEEVYSFIDKAVGRCVQSILNKKNEWMAKSLLNQVKKFIFSIEPQPKKTILGGNNQQGQEEGAAEEKYTFDDLKEAVDLIGGSDYPLSPSQSVEELQTNGNNFFMHFEMLYDRQENKLSLNQKQQLDRLIRNKMVQLQDTFAGETEKRIEIISLKDALVDYIK